MDKLDFKKTLKGYFNAPKGAFEIVDIPKLSFAMVDGQGNPNTSAAYGAAVQALFATSYTLKFMSKAEGRDYVVPPLQGLWWAEDWGDFVRRKKDRWSWTMMILQPEWIGAAPFADAVETVRRKGQAIPETLRLEAFEEGRSVQTLHIGSYDDEAPVLQRLHKEFLPANGLVERGKHHEIYLSDPRRVAPEKLKTILRQPVNDA